MNVLFNQFLFSFSKEIVAEIIEGIGAKKAFCITAAAGRFSEEEKAKMDCEIHTFDYNDLYWCVYKDVNWNELEPVDGPLLEKMALYENELMYMMERDFPTHSYYSRSRFDKEVVDPILQFKRFKYEFHPLPYLERKRLYERHLRYWYNFYKKNDIQYFITESLPHNSHDYIAFRVAQLFGIRIVMGGYIPGYRRWLVFEDYRKSDPYLPVVYKELKETVKVDDLKWDKSTEDEWNRLANNELPWYTKPRFADPQRQKEKADLMRETAMNNIMNFAVPAENYSKVSTIKKWMQLDYWFHILNWQTHNDKFQDKLFAYYESLCTPPDYSKKYIYVPLHFQPEVTTAPMGGRYANQVLMVQTLAHYLPKDWLIYVKENPYQENRCRNAEFYQDLASLPNVRLVSRKINTFELSSNCAATAAITGTAGWEGLFKGKPYLMFGYFCVMYAPGVFSIKSNEDCEQALRTISSNDFSVDKDDLKYFMKALEVCSVAASPDIDTFLELNIPREQNTHRMAQAYIDFIKGNYDPIKQLEQQVQHHG